MKKRLTALLLVLSLVLSLGATVAFATDEDDVPVAPVVDDPDVQDPVVDDPDGDELQKARVDALYGQLMAAQSTAEVAALAENMTDEEISAFFSALTEDEYAALEAHLNDLAVAEYVPPETVVFTDAGPFMPAVNVAPVRRLLRAPATYQNDPEPADNGLVTQKTVTANDDGTYTIRLESWTTGKVTTSTKTIPVDIVLVLDQSGSMADDFSGNTTHTNSDRRQYAMKQAVNNFIEKVAEKYSTDADHRMAIVTFGSSASTLQGWTFVDESGKSTLQGKISGLPNSPSGATNVAAGMEQAETLMGSGYSYTGANSQRQKVVIVFTDGVPTTSSDFDTNVATNAIASAKSLKDGGATVYTVGIFTGANPGELYGASGFDTNSDGTVNSKWVKDTWGLFPGTDFPEADRPAGNRFLNLLSSNYESADSIGLNRATKGLGILRYKITYTITTNYSSTGSGYYLTANDSATLNNIFQTISDNIQTANIDLGSATFVKDVVTDYFDLPANTSAITLYTAAAKADGSFEDPISAPDDVIATIDPSTNAVTVTGFDYNANFVSENAKEDGSYGKKLIVEFTITPKQDFLGGDNVPTNGAASGVYDKDGNPVENFTVPTTSVPIGDIVVTANDQNVYLLGSVTKEQLLSGTATVGGTPLNLNPAAENYGLQSWQTAYVNITVEIKNESGTVVTSFADLTDDQTYSVTVTVSPKETVAGGATAKTGTANAAINVFKPELTYEDKTIYVGNEAVYNPVEVWKHVDPDTDTVSTDDDVTMTGQKPTLTLSYDPESTALTECTDVNVTAKIGSTDVTAHVTFYNGGNKHIGSASEAEFTVHVLKPIITVETQDIWADTETTFNLSDYCFQKTDNKPFVCTWQDTTSGHATPSPLPSGAPSVDVSFTFKNGDATINNSYTVGQEDETITVSVLTYTLGNGYTSDVNLTDKGFTVHVNKFTMTITKDWGTTAGTYKQSCIFDVKLGSEVVATVVIPNGESSVTIGGLLCGKEYTVEEQGDWSWRFTKGQKTTLTSHSHPIANEQPTGHAPVNVAVRNELSISQWLSGDFWAINRSGTGLVTDKKGGSQ